MTAMLTCSRYLLVLAQLLLLAEAPIPWAHSHDMLNDQHLQVHLQTYHMGQTVDNSPSDWHFHVALIGHGSRAAIPAPQHCVPPEILKTWLVDCRDLLTMTPSEDIIFSENANRRLSTLNRGLSHQAVLAGYCQVLLGIFLL